MNVVTIDKLQPSDELRLGTVGLKLFFNLTDQWKLKQAEQLTLLGLASRSTLQNWKSKTLSGEDIRLSKDTLERLSLIAGIRKGVELLFPQGRWIDYMNAPNREFGNMTPLQVMLGGRITALYQVRRYLDNSRGSHFG